MVAVAFCFQGSGQGDAAVLAQGEPSASSDAFPDFSALYAQRAEEFIRNYQRDVRNGTDNRKNGPIILARMERIKRGWGDATDTVAQLGSDILNTLTWGSNDFNHSLPNIAYGLRKYPDLVSASLKEMVFRRCLELSFPNGYGNRQVGVKRGPGWNNHMTTYLACVILSSEALGETTRLQEAKTQFAYLFRRVMRDGELEFNSPSYDDLNFMGLNLLLGSDDSEIRMMAKFLLDLKWAYTAHILLPDYEYVGPESRDYAGAVEDEDSSQTGVYLVLPAQSAPERWTITDEMWAQKYTLAQAATGYQPPDQVRAIYLGKGAFSFTWRRNAEISPSFDEGSAIRLPEWMPESALTYVSTIPMHYYVLKDQVAAMGAAHAYTSGSVSNGQTNSIYTAPSVGKTVLTQIQPGDSTDYLYGGEPGSGEDDWVREYGGKVRRVFYRNAFIQIWNPYGKTYPFTQVHIPKYNQLDRVGDWWFGRQGEAFIAYRVLGDALTVKERPDYWLVRADGNSGGVAEIAHSEEYAGSFEAFKSDILSRSVSWNAGTPDETGAPEASYQARGEQGDLVTISVRYGADPMPGSTNGTRRTVGGRELTLADLTYPLLESPYLTFERDASTFEISYPGYATLVYDWQNLAITELPMSVFADVPPSHLYFREIEALYRAGYAAGCNTSPLMYCPDQTMNRAESAVFVERGIHAATYDPPLPSAQVFGDLALDSWAAKWVNGLWNDQYTAGCGANPLIYCPWQGHTRAEGCVFYMRMLRGANYEPPPPSQQMFADVPLEAWYAKWVQAAYDAELINACQTSPELRFCPDDPLSRGLAAYMMVRAKGLPLQ